MRGKKGEIHNGSNTPHGMATNLLALTSHQLSQVWCRKSGCCQNGPKTRRTSWATVAFSDRPGQPVRFSKPTGLASTRGHGFQEES